MKEQKSMAQQISDFICGKYDDESVDTQIKAGWYDWFCKDYMLPGKTHSLYKKVISIAKSKKFDPDKVYIFFKNNCPVNGKLYDSFSICSMRTGEVLFWITPKQGHSCYDCEAQVCGPENGFGEPLAKGNWQDIETFFLN
jgi:hypothetical protein